MTKGKRLAKAQEDLYQARAVFERKVAKEYPAGSSIRWLRGNYSSIQYGHVICTGGDRIKVRNAITQREYFVGLYDVLQATP